MQAKILLRLARPGPHDNDSSKDTTAILGRHDRATTIKQDIFRHVGLDFPFEGGATFLSALHRAFGVRVDNLLIEMKRWGFIVPVESSQQQQQGQGLASEGIGEKQEQQYQWRRSVVDLWGSVEDVERFLCAQRRSSRAAHTHGQQKNTMESVLETSRQSIPPFASHSSPPGAATTPSMQSQTPQIHRPSYRNALLSSPPVPDKASDLAPHSHPPPKDEAPYPAAESGLVNTMANLSLGKNDFASASLSPFPLNRSIWSPAASEPHLRLRTSPGHGTEQPEKLGNPEGQRYIHGQARHHSSQQVGQPLGTGTSLINPNIPTASFKPVPMPFWPQPLALRPEGRDSPSFSDWIAAGTPRTALDSMSEAEIGNWLTQTWTMETLLAFVLEQKRTERAR